MFDLTTQLLETIHDVLAKADESEKFMKALADNDTMPADVRIKFAEAESALSLQSHIIRRLTEEAMEVEDKVQTIVSKLPKQ